MGKTVEPRKASSGFSLLSSTSHTEDLEPAHHLKIPHVTSLGSDDITGPLVSMVGKLLKLRETYLLDLS